MPVEFRWVYTALGLAKRAAAEANGALVAPATFLVGDGLGAYHTPEEIVANGGLYNQVWTGAVNRIYQHSIQDNLVVIEAVIPPEVGGWTIREAGIKDAAGDLILVGKYPATEKPGPGSGGEKQIMVRGGMRISNGGDTVLQIGSSLVMATQEYVDQHALAAAPHAGHVNHSLAATVNDMLVAAGAGAWVKKTLAEVKAILGLGDAAYKNTGTAAGTVSAGDHNHAGTYELANANLQTHVAASAPHAGHVNHSLATAVNDFLVAFGVGSFVKKTLAETKTILGLDNLALVPVGSVIYCAKNSAPAGYLKANGAAVSRATYAALFATVGEVFGVGDGATTFNLPDLRGEFVRGWDDARGIDSGRVFGSSQADDFKSHAHTVDGSSGVGALAGVWAYEEKGSSIASTDANTTKSAGGAETRPRNIALLACIKY